MPCSCQAHVFVTLPKLHYQHLSVFQPLSKNSSIQITCGSVSTFNVVLFSLSLLIMLFLGVYIDFKDGHQLFLPSFTCIASTPIKEWSLFRLTLNKGLDIVRVLGLAFKRSGSFGFYCLGSSQCIEKPMFSCSRSHMEKGPGRGVVIFLFQPLLNYSGMQP